jgi:uncharacterized membrane protein (DUF485 family)
MSLESVSALRWRIAVSLTIAMMVAYFGFILLIAFNKPLMGLGILLGALVIVFAWVLTWYYVRWANSHYDSALHGLRASGPGAQRPAGGSR